MVPQERLRWVQSQKTKLELASNVSVKDGPTYLSPGIEYRTIFELLNSGSFLKESRTGYVHIFVLYELLQERELSEEERDHDSLLHRTTSSKANQKGKVKEEPKVKAEAKIKMEPKNKTVPKIKTEASVKAGSQKARKRGISQVSQAYDKNEKRAVQDQGEELDEESDLESLSDILPGAKQYSLRRR
jgi:hypothetical protein